MKNITATLALLFTLYCCTAQKSTTVKMGKATLKIEGQEINKYQTRDVRTNEVFTITNYFNITDKWIFFYEVVMDGKTAFQVYETKISGTTKLTATMEEEQNERYMQATMYKVIIKCPQTTECATQTVTTKGEVLKQKTKETEIILLFENKAYAESFTKAFKAP